MSDHVNRPLPGRPSGGDTTAEGRNQARPSRWRDASADAQNRRQDARPWAVGT